MFCRDRLRFGGSVSLIARDSRCQKIDETIHDKVEAKTCPELQSWKPRVSNMLFLFENRYDTMIVIETLNNTQKIKIASDYFVYVCLPSMFDFCWSWLTSDLRTLSLDLRTFSLELQGLSRK